MAEMSFEEIAAKVIAGEMSQQAGADLLGMARMTFVVRLNREYPDRPKGVNVRRTNRQPVSGRPHKATYIERAYTDETLCRDLACRHCPLHTEDGECNGPKGLVKAMLHRSEIRKGDCCDGQI